MGFVASGAPVADQTPADVVRGSVPSDILSALEQDLCEHSWKPISVAIQVSTVQNSPVQEIGRLVKPHQESVPCVSRTERVFLVTDGAEAEMPQPTRRFQSVEATRIDPERPPIDEDHFEMETDTQVYTVFIDLEFCA